MLTTRLIAKKRDGGKLSKAEIEFLVSGYTRGEVPDYQMSAFLMSAYLKGLDDKETFYLTEAMLNSGKRLDLSDVPGAKIDKHSTGGVGDKISLIVAPLVSACGVKVPMIAGRGLGHTGGTVDKLEAIPGFRSNLSLEEFKSNLQTIGLCICGQSDEIAPADRKIYALRDVTATVDFIPFITASILSKKIAEGADGIVLDVKIGEGAFMKTLSQAKELAGSLVAIGSKFKRRYAAILTDMSEPLGEAVGNSLEVKEAIEALKGNWKKDLRQVTYFLAAEMLLMAKKCRNYGQAYRLLTEVNSDGTALNKFREMVARQGGDVRVVDDCNLLPRATAVAQAESAKTGYVTAVKTERIGWLAVELGAGRRKKEDPIDHSAGFLIKKKIGDLVRKNDELAEVHGRSVEEVDEVATKLRECFVISKKRVKSKPKILYRISSGAGSIVKRKDIIAD